MARERTLMALNINWIQAHRIATQLARKLKPMGFLELYAVPRGGLMPAYWMATMLEIPKQRIYTSNLDWHSLWANSTGRILIIDDISDTGATHQLIKSRIKNKYTFATLIRKNHNNQCPSHISGISLNTPEWVVFPWEDTNETKSNPNEGVSSLQERDDRTS